MFIYIVMKSGNLNFLEPSGPLQTCNGTALPLPFIYAYRSSGQEQVAGSCKCGNELSGSIKCREFLD